MRLALAAALVMLASPAMARSAKSTTTKGPRNGQFCAKAKVGTTATDAEGNKLECKAGAKGRARWTK